LRISDCGMRIERLIIPSNPQSQIRNPQLPHCSCQISTLFPVKIGISMRFRLPS
jgi:hypothetical protein